MDYLLIIKEYGVPVMIGAIGWLAGKGKNRAETRKLQAETELIYSEKYRKDLEATKSFREMLVSENESLIKEIREMKVRYEETTFSLKKQIKELTDQLNIIIDDREYNRCKGVECETAIAYKKIIDARVKRKAKKQQAASVIV